MGELLPGRQSQDFLIAWSQCCERIEHGVACVERESRRIVGRRRSGLRGHSIDERPSAPVAPSRRSQFIARDTKEPGARVGGIGRHLFELAPGNGERGAQDVFGFVGVGGAPQAISPQVVIVGVVQKPESLRSARLDRRHRRNGYIGLHLGVHERYSSRTPETFHNFSD